MATAASITANNKSSQRSCARCRDKKVKCDKEEPCQRCRNAGVSCIYPTPIVQEHVGPQAVLPRVTAPGTTYIQPGNNSAKRTKIKEPACIRCKEKRVKCDRNKPDCRRCASHHVQCEYPVRSIWVYDTTPRNFQEMFESDSGSESEPELVTPPQVSHQERITPPRSLGTENVYHTFGGRQQQQQRQREQQQQQQQQQQQRQQQQQQQQQRQQQQQQQQQRQQQQQHTIMSFQPVQETARPASELKWEMSFGPGNLDISSNLDDVNDLLRYVIDGMNQTSLSDTDSSAKERNNKPGLKPPNTPQEHIQKFDNSMFLKLSPDRIAQWYQMLEKIETTLTFPNNATRKMFRNIALQGLISHCIYYYFHCFSQKIPLMHKARFIQRFHDRYGDLAAFASLSEAAASTSDDDIEPLTIYSLCAFVARHACHFHAYKPLETLDRANEAADYFYHLARRELEDATVDRGESSPELIHALIHLAEYDESRGRDEKARALQAMAVRMALELRIHERTVPEADMDLWTPAEVEINRRLWWYLWLRDRTYVIRGREPVISGDYEMLLPLPTPMTEEDEELRHTIGCWVVEIGLMKIQKEVVETVLKVWTTLRARDVVERVMGIERKLREVYDGLPVYLRLDGGYKYKVDNRRAFLACIIVNLELQGIWLQLHKPFLPPIDSPEAATSPFVKRSHAICTKAATMITVLIDNCWKTGFCYTDLIELSRACDIHLREIQYHKETHDAQRAKAELKRTLNFLPRHPYSLRQSPATVQFLTEIRQRLGQVWDQADEPIPTAEAIWVPELLGPDATSILPHFIPEQLPEPSPPSLLYARYSPNLQPSSFNPSNPRLFASPSPNPASDTDLDYLTTDFDWDTTPSPGYTGYQTEGSPPISDEELAQLYQQSFGESGDMDPETDTGGLAEAALFDSGFESERGLKVGMLKDGMLGWYHRTYDFEIESMAAFPEPGYTAKPKA